MLYVYLHGFNSAYDPTVSKVQSLLNLGEVIGITYDSFGTYQGISDQISHEFFAQVHDRDDVVFVGTSLGGFWAAEMGRRFGAPSIAINPCIDPRNMLHRYVNEPQVNYISGKRDVLSAAVVHTYPSEEHFPDISAYKFLPFILLDANDAVINSFETLRKTIQMPGMIWEGGSHRFEHMQESLELISRYVNRCYSTGISD